MFADVALRAEERISDAELLDFTTAVRERLPWELRDEIYKHLFDEQTLHHMDYADRKPSLYPEPPFIRPWTVLAEQPRFMKPGAVDAQLVKEILQAFYEVCDLGVRHPGHISSILKENIFGLGITPNMGPLSSLIVHIDLKPGTLKPIVMSDLFDQFAPLLKAGQLSSHFKLCLRLTIPYMPLELLQMQTLVDILAALKPSFEAIHATSIYCTISMFVDLGVLDDFYIPNLQNSEQMNRCAADWEELVRTQYSLCFPSDFEGDEDDEEDSEDD